MNFDQLRSFQQVALTGSFTKAARKLFLTQPAVSQQIKALEESNEVKLFDRTGQKIKLTPEGELLLSKTSHLIAEFRGIERLFKELSELDIGSIDITSTAIFSTYFLPRAMGRYNSRYPGIELDLHTGNSHRVISKLLEGRADFGFGGVVKPEPDIESILIHQEPFTFVVGAGHQLAGAKNVSIQDLETVPFIWREHGTLIRRKMEEMLAGPDVAFTPGNVIEVQNVETGKRLVEEGYGVTIIPAKAVRREVKAGQLKEISFPGFNLKASYYLFCLKNRSLSKHALAFLTLLPQTVHLSQADNLCARVDTEHT